MSFLEKLLWEEGGNLDFFMMSMRAVLVFLTAFIYIRIAKKRFLGRNTAFDIVLSIIMGSLFARTINGSAPFLPSAVAGLVLIGLHHTITYLFARFPEIGNYFEGNPKSLMKNGELDKKSLLEHHLSEKDILEAVRKDMQSDDISVIEQCYLENNGKLTVIKRK